MEVEEEPEGSGCAGAAVITAVVLAFLAGSYAVAPEVFVIGAWAVGWSALVWHAKRVPPAPNPAPPPVPEGAVEEEPQVTAMQDVSHPNRWLVVRESPWMTVEITKEES